MPLLIRPERVREQVVCLPAQGTACPPGQHHERDRPAAGTSTENALSGPGQPVVRTQLRGGDRVREGGSDAQEPGAVCSGADHDPRPSLGCRADHGSGCPGAEGVAGWTRGE